MRQQGFTLPELIAVLIITSILAVSVSGMFDRKGFDSVGFADEVRAQLAFAQKTAVASRREIRVVAGANSLSFTICDNGVCPPNDPMLTLRGKAALQPPDNSVITLAPATTFFFLPDGSASAGVTFTIGGDTTNRFVNVVQSTGYVY